MKIGLFGGTFNPPHLGHLRLAEGAAEALGLDELLWIPANAPPHKGVEGPVSPEDRCRMVELAIQGHPTFRLCRVELDRPPPSYTVETVRQLQAERGRGQHRWYFLMGADAARGLATWREPEELFSRLEFVAVHRPGGAAGPLPTQVRLLALQTPEISASEVRRRIRKGESIEGLVPEPVRRYIEERRLYR